MKVLDKYILKKFFGTLIFMIALLAFVFIVIDINQKYGRLSENGFSIYEALTGFYPFYLVWAINTFFSILVFISIMYFTSRIANDTEIVAIISSGISFYRFSFPYVVGGIIICVMALSVNHIFLPMANIKKNEFLIKTLVGRKKSDYVAYKKIASQISPNEYLFVKQYSRVTKSGTGFVYQKFDSVNHLKHEVIANGIVWSEIDTTYALKNYYERFVREGKNDSLISGIQLKEKFPFTPDELLPEAYVAETMNSFELQKFIEREKIKGSGNVNTYKTELYQRTSMPVSVIILTILALSLSSIKRRGGIGINLAIGIVIAFAFIFSFQVLAINAQKNNLHPLVAVWLPNVVFGLLALYLYVKRARA